MAGLKLIKDSFVFNFENVAETCAEEAEHDIYSLFQAYHLVATMKQSLKSLSGISLLF